VRKCRVRDILALEAVTVVEVCLLILLEKMTDRETRLDVILTSSSDWEAQASEVLKGATNIYATSKPDQPGNGAIPSQW